MHVRIANAPVSWGVDYAADPENPPWERVLDEIAGAGYTHLEPGPVGYLPEDPERLSFELAARGLTPVGTFIFDFLHDPAQRERVVCVATRACRLVAACGGTHFVVIDHLAPDRMPVAGRPAEGRRLDAAELRDALSAAREADGPVTIVVHVEPRRGLVHTGAWWDLGVAEVSDRPEVQEIAAERAGHAQAQRFYY